METQEKLKFEERQLKSEYSLKTFAIINNVDYKDLRCFLEDVFKIFNEKISNLLLDFPDIKIETHLEASFVQENSDKVKQTKCFTQIETEIDDVNVDLNTWYNIKIKDEIIKQVEDEIGLGWKLFSIKELIVDCLEKTVEYQEKKTAFKKRIQTFSIINIKHKDPKRFLDEAGQIFEKKLHDILQDQHRIKVHTCFEAEYVRKELDDALKKIPHFIHTISKMIDIDTNLKEWFVEKVKNTILNQIEMFQQNGSGWSLDSIKQLEIGCNKCNDFTGSSYITLPEEVQSRKAVINIQNNDDHCFKWALLSALHPVNKNAQRVTKYKRYEHELNFKGIEFPVKIKDITKFEEMNNISVNVYVIDKNNSKANVIPIRITKNVKNKHVHLLLLTENCSDENDKCSDIQVNVINLKIKSDYCWIKDLSRLMRANITKHEHKCYICDRCLHFYHSKEEVLKHEKDCKLLNSCKITLPCIENKWISFKNYKNQLKVPFVIYADIESLLKHPSKTCDQKIRGAYQRHIPYSIGHRLLFKMLL